MASAEVLLKDYKPKQAAVDAEVARPQPREHREAREALEVNGMKVALLAKKNRGETVFFSHDRCRRATRRRSPARASPVR